MKQVMILETLDNISKNVTAERGADGFLHLEGVFGMCGVRNRNQRVYEYSNYKKCVDELQMIIERDGGVAGEMEHPTDLNTHMNNISHKIERVSIDEKGVITGRICLLNTESGKNAQAIVEGGLPLFISSRGFGDEDGQGNVTLEGIVTYDLVGTPGFEQARLSLTEARKSFCESYNPNKEVTSNYTIIPLNESTNLPSVTPTIDENNVDLKALIDAKIAEALKATNGGDDKVTVELMEAYISEVVKKYIDECVTSLAETFDESMNDINERLDVMKEKIMGQVKATKVPQATRSRVYLYNR